MQSLLTTPTPSAGYHQPEHRRVGAFGQVGVGAGEHVAAPGVGEVGGALGDVLVGLDVDLDVHQVDEFAEVGAGLRRSSSSSVVLTSVMPGRSNAIAMPSR